MADTPQRFTLPADPSRPAVAFGRRRFLGLAGALAAAGTLAACATPLRDTKRARGWEVGDSPPKQFERALMGSHEPTTVRVGLILGPPAMGLNRFLLDANAGKTHHNFDFQVTGVDYAALAAQFNQNQFDIVTLPSNLGAVLHANHELETQVEVINVGNLGILYAVTTDPSVNRIEDLAGRTVYSIGQGGTPEYTIATIMEGYGLAEKTDIAFRSTPFEVLNLLQNEPKAIAIIPQPFVELARTMVNGLRTPIDLTQLWDDMPTNTTRSRAVTTHTLVNRNFLEAHESAVVEYLQRTGDSVDFTLGHVAEAAAVQEELGTFLNNEVAEHAIPYCSIVNLTGTVMHEALSGFLGAIHARQPAATGGETPRKQLLLHAPTRALETELLHIPSGAAANVRRR